MSWFVGSVSIKLQKLIKLLLNNMHDHAPDLAKSLRVSIVVITLSLVMSK